MHQLEEPELWTAHCSRRHFNCFQIVWSKTAGFRGKEILEKVRAIFVEWKWTRWNGYIVLKRVTVTVLSLPAALEVKKWKFQITFTQYRFLPYNCILFIIHSIDSGASLGEQFQHCILVSTKLAIPANIKCVDLIFPLPTYLIWVWIGSETLDLESTICLLVICGISWSSTCGEEKQQENSIGAFMIVDECRDSYWMTWG